MSSLPGFDELLPRRDDDMRNMIDGDGGGSAHFGATVQSTSQRERRQRRRTETRTNVAHVRKKGGGIEGGRQRPEYEAGLGD